MKNKDLILKIYAITLTLVLLFFYLKKSNKIENKFDEITVERINVVEPDGKLKMVISNKEKQHPGMKNGKLFPSRERAPGLLFFNEEQDEVGGLIYNGNKEIGGNNLGLSYDQFKNDQVMQLFYRTKKDGDNSYGLQLWDRSKTFTQKRYLELIDSLDNEGYNYPRKLEFMKKENGGKPVHSRRLKLSRNYNGEAGLFIQDEFGKERLRVYIDKDNNPKIELLDENEKVIKDILKN